MITNIVTEVKTGIISYNSGGSVISEGYTGVLDTNDFVDLTLVVTGKFDNLIAPGIQITSIEQSNYVNMSDATVVPAHKIIGQMPLIIPAPGSVIVPDDRFMATIGLVGTQRYIRLKYDSAGGNGSSVLIVFDYVAKPRITPPTA